MTKSDVYPPTIWSRYRENAIHWIVLAGMAVVAAGLVLDLEWLKHLGLGVAALAVLSVVLVLALEYRADMKHDREHPTDEGATPSWQ